MDKHAKIYVAGHRGLVGSALMRNLRDKGYTNFFTRTHAQLDLTVQTDVEALFELEKPDYVFLAAAKVGGIHANNSYPAEFIRDNLAIQTHIIHAAYKNGVKRLLFLGALRFDITRPDGTFRNSWRVPTARDLLEGVYGVQAWSGERQSRLSR